MTCLNELDGDAWCHFEGALVADRLQVSQRPMGVDFGVKRQRRRVFRESVAVGLTRILLLNPAGIRQDHAAEVRRARGAEGPAPEALRDQARQVADVVQVCVGEHDGMDRGGLDRKVVPVPEPQLLQPLEETAVEEHPGAIDVQQVLRAGYRVRRAEKGQFSHTTTILC